MTCSIYGVKTVVAKKCSHCFPKKEGITTFKMLQVTLDTLVDEASAINTMFESEFNPSRIPAFVTHHPAYSRTIHNMYTCRARDKLHGRSG